MEHVLDDSASAKQIRSVVDLLERDFHNRRGTLEEQISSIRARMRGRVAPSSGADTTTASRRLADRSTRRGAARWARQDFPHASRRGGVP
jgi:hypothetical protein